MLPPRSKGGDSIPTSETNLNPSQEGVGHESEIIAVPQPGCCLFANGDRYPAIATNGSYFVGTWEFYFDITGQLFYSVAAIP